MLVTNLLNFIIGFKMFLRIEKNFKEKGENKVSMKMRINSCVITYYNPYFDGFREFDNVNQIFFF